MAAITKLGLIGDPYCVGWACDGIEASCAAFRKAGLVEAMTEVVDEVKDFGDIEVDLPPFDKSHPELLNPGQVKAASRVLADKVEEVMRAGYVPLIFGGEDSVMLGILEGMKRVKGEPLGQVFLDAHADYNIPATSPSGLIGGMENAILAGHGPEELTKLFRDEPQLAEENITLYGTRDIDPGEQVSLDNSDVRVWRAERIREVGPAKAMGEVVADLRRRVENVYLHIDLDILDESQMSAHVLPVPDGLLREEFITSVRELIGSGLICCLAIMVFDTRKDLTCSEAKKVVAMAADFIGA